MMQRFSAVKVGAVVVAAVLVTWAIYRFVEERTGGGGIMVWALFDDAQGLVPKSRVQIAGINVGYIERIRLEGNRARVDIHIDEEVPLYEDARVAKRTASILGEALLAIDPGTPTKARVKNGDRIAVAYEGTSTDAVLEDVGAIAKSVRSVARQLETAFGDDEAGRKMSGALDNLSQALESVNRTISQNEEVISRTLRNLEGATADAAPKLQRILENVEQSTADVRSIIGSNRDGLQKAGGRVDDTVASIQRASHELEQVLSDVHTVTDRTAKGEGTLGRLTHDEALVDEVEGVVEGVGSIVGGISRLQTIVELRSEFNFLANTFKNYVGLRIQPREDRYYFVQLINDPRGLTEFTQTEVRRSPPPEGEPAFFQETRVETRDAFRFSLLFAKRIQFATFRFGILESTGGLGVDIHLLDDHLEVTTDIFAVGEQAFPRLRTKLAYEVVQRLWLVGGIDDAFNESSDFFLGAMLRFNDEDLKSILPFVGSSVGSAGGS